MYVLQDYGEEREVKLEDMIEELRWIKDDWPNYTPTALVKDAEHDGVSLGTFNVEKIELNHETHTVEFVCEGKMKEGGGVGTWQSGTGKRVGA